MIKKFDKKDEESGSGSNPFQHLEKSAVLQEARIFNETPINPRRCLHILTKIIYLLNQGEHFGTTEATEAFFAMTRLFQSNDQTLRRMCYLTIKEMANISEDVIIVTSSLTKDMTGKEDVYRGPAIRALCRITDTTMLQAIERYMKQAIVDKVPSVSSSALVSSLHMVKMSYDVVKRWVNEAQEAASSDNIMSDRLAVSKMLNKFTKSGLKSPFAYCMLIRIASKLLEETEGGHDSPLFDFIECCLRNKNEMVVYEAASAIVHMPNCTARELAPAVAMKHPSAVTACNLDLENLITDSNRSIATLAITTLLKTGSESSVDRLMKQISSFVSEISDEFKVVVVQAISALCQKYPRKHSVMMNFLSNMLRDDENPESKETGLAHLCEFIEDCEHTVLATKILHLLGKEGPRTPAPSKYIRFIFNRVVLESEAVRAAAVSALAKFGAQNDDLLPSVLVLMQRCMMDSDDEVRDRATFYMNVLQQKQKALTLPYIFNASSQRSWLRRAKTSTRHMVKMSYDVVKRWVNEAQEAASSDNIMVQSDRLAVSKMLNKFTKSGLKSPFAYCMLIRIASKLLEETEGGHDSPLFDFIECCLRNKNEMVVYEAASAIVHMPNCTARELAPAVSVLQLFCSSPKAALRYAAVRTLNKVAMKHPSAVVVVQAISALCQKYPRKHSVMMNFLSNMLRDDENPESKETGLAHLCEFIEDCEHTVLATKILHLLGKEGPRTPAPSKYIRFIFNRVVLESEAVRAEMAPVATSKLPEKLAPSRQDIYQEQLAAIPEFQGLGPLFKSSEALQLTEAETEYVVRCVKHTFARHMVFQFDCTNTLNDQLLQKVVVQMEPSESYEVLHYLPAASLPYSQPGSCYSLVRLPDDDPTAVSCTFSCTMKYLVRDCDPNTGEPDDDGYDDEYVLEDLEVTVADHIQKVLKPNFGAAWEEVGDDFEKEETFALASVRTLDEAVGNIVSFLGMQPCERSDKVPENKNSHVLFLAGVFRGGHDLLVRARLALSDGVTMQVTVRATDETPVDVILASVG
ncbi:hypothetical protein CRUP_018580 [Coryphaenoides rupestris]|nr:hypothetical protein CRUP_018580 [Coryphaenoides rupestris]